MDWLTGLPWIGPRIAAVLRTHAYRAFAHLLSVHWTRLAAALTFTSFLALFPLLTVVAAVGAALLSDRQLNTLEHKISQQIPGIADQLNISGLVAHAGTVGIIAGAVLLFTGVGWIGSLRDVLRAIWGKDNEPRNPFTGKLWDGAVLFGLGAAVLVSLGASALATAAVDWTARHLGFAHSGPGPTLLTLVGILLAVVADFLILVFLLTLMPAVDPPRRSVFVAALIGAVGFELLKVLLSGYLQKVAGRNVYGAFGTPVALLLWINFVAKLLLYCAAWTATPVHAPPPDAGEPAPGDARDSGSPKASGPAGPGNADAGADGKAGGKGNGPANGGTGAHRLDRQARPRREAAAAVARR
ncbi:membrane protein [Streptomyces sp. DvalAA-14]|nr:YihY/virulence factor BrkB family protein [Streptomyces sp. SID4948]SCE21017.1 membrane protein [Streptomyces sp. DvalAA-14]